MRRIVVSGRELDNSDREMGSPQRAELAIYPLTAGWFGLEMATDVRLLLRFCEGEERSSSLRSTAEISICLHAFVEAAICWIPLSAMEAIS